MACRNLAQQLLQDMQNRVQCTMLPFDSGNSHILIAHAAPLVRETCRGKYPPAYAPMHYPVSAGALN
jgi:hypothetical protein